MNFATAQATQIGETGDWVVTTADGKTELGTLPGKLTPAEAMAMIHLARAAERGGYAAGKSEALQQS